MIKKTFTVISMFLLTTMLMWAVWEGNAAAGSNDEFPAGLFAYSTLLPKHTLIEVLNLENNRSSRAVVIGNTGTDGLIIKMSPDLAAALAVRIGNTVRIRLSVPAHVAETGADPVLITKNPDIPVYEPAPAAPLEEPASSDEETVVPEEPVLLPDEPLPLAEDTVFSEEAVAEQPAGHEEGAGTAEVHPAPKEVAPVPERMTASEMPPAAPEEVASPVRPVDGKAPESPHPVAEVEEPLRPEPITPGADSAAVTPVPPVQTMPAEPVSGPLPVAEVEEPVPPAAPVMAEALPAEAEPFTEAEPDEPELYEAYNEIPEYLAVEDEEPAKPEADIPAAAEPAETAGDEAADEPLAETLPVEEVPPLEPAAVPEEEMLAAVPPVPVEQTVMLIPVAPKEPEGEPPAQSPIPQEETVPPPPAPAPAPEKPATEAADESYVAGTLKPGAFYVQIGNFADSLNVQSFIQRYGKQYPVAVEKSTGGHPAVYRVYIGPLKKDERGAALETFHKLGFKDAFLKKIP